MSRWEGSGWRGSLTLTQGLWSSLRCPFAGDNYRTQLVPVGPATLQLPFPSHYQRFAISTFAFVDSPSMVVLEGEVRQGGSSRSAGPHRDTGCDTAPCPTGVHPVQRLRVPPVTARALPALLPSGRAFP